MATKRKQREQGNEDSKKHWTVVGGFDSFNPRGQPSKRRKFTRRASFGPKKLKLVKCDELPEPESGIHSLAWAQAIVPQSSGFLKLPIEARNQIYKHVIGNWSCGPEKGSPIMPWKKGRKFRDPDWKNAPQETAALYLLCRQVYVDVVGSGLLYKFRKFYFSSPTTMLNYLWVINPRHKDAIRTIRLDLNLTTFLKCFDTEPPRTCGRPFEMIASCKNLRHFSLNIKLCREHYSIQWGAPSNLGYLGYYSTVRSISIYDYVLKAISECVALRSIRGLKSFEMLWVPKLRYYRGDGPLPFEEKNEERLLLIGEEIRKLVTSKQE